MNELKEKNANELKAWNNFCLNLSLQSELNVEDLYESYCYYIINHIGSIPLNRKTFVTRLKFFLNDHVINNRVRFFYKKGSKVAGIKINK